jgi:opacity protein-like surface antigen
MRGIWQVAATGVLAILFGNGAKAADMRPYPSAAPPLLESAPLLVDEFSSGWYLRGDIGYRMNRVDQVTNESAPPGVRNDDLDTSWLIGAGVGHKWDWFRADLTVDYGTKSKFFGDSAVRNNDFTAKIDTVTGLVNFYGDLGTWSGFTPYIGAGFGFAHLQAANFDVRSAHALDVDSTGKWNFAWAYMAGVSYHFMGNYTIDLGYRHINMGDVKTGIDQFGNQLAFKKLSADEIRLGFRYVID